MDSKEGVPITVKEMLEKVKDQIGKKIENLLEPKNNEAFQRPPLSENSRKEIKEMTHIF